jgi:hypothetical protein
LKGRTKTPTLRFIIQELGNGNGQQRAVVGRHHQASLAVFHELGQAADIGAYHWATCQSSLGNGEAKRLSVRGMNENVR